MTMADIAYVDDDKDCLEIIESSFADIGIEIDIFDDAIEFYNFGKEYKVLISDYEMPGMNGEEFITLLKERFPKTKTLIYSGIIDKVDFKNLEIDAFLHKPMEFESLMKNVKYLLFEYNKQNKDSA